MPGRHAALVHRPVGAAAQLAGAEPGHPEVRDDFAVRAKRLVVLVHGDAGAQRGHAHVLMDAPERRLLDLLEVLRLLAEVRIEPGVDHLVIARDGLLERIGGDLQLRRKLVQGVAAIRADEAFDDVRAAFGRAVHLHVGHVHLDLFLVGGLAAPLRDLLDVIVVEDLGIPTRFRLVAQHAVHFLEHAVLVHEAFAVLVHEQERLFEHGAGVEVVHHVGVAHGHEPGAHGHGHEDAVAGLVALLAVELLHVGAITLHEALVVLVVAGGQDDALRGVELDVGAAAFADHAGHGS